MAMKITLYRLAVFGLLLVAWAVASGVAGGNLIPTPLETLAAARELFADGRLGAATIESLRVYFGGFLLAAVAGVPLGLAMGANRDLGRTLEIYVNALMATPRVAFIPLIIVFLGLGEEAKITIVFLGAVMPILVNTYAGILQADEELVEMSRSLGASRLQIYFRIMLPGALPFVAVGLRTRRHHRAHQHSCGRALHRSQRAGRPPRPLWQHLPDGPLLRSGADPGAGGRRGDPVPAPPRASRQPLAPRVALAAHLALRLYGLWGKDQRSRRGMNAFTRLAAVAAAAGLSAFAAPGWAEPFRLILTDLTAPLVPNSVMELAAELGYFEREGVDVELVRVQQTPSALAALQAGEGEMANISVDAALQLTARDQLALKAVMSPNKSLPFLIAAREGIADVESLGGHSFAVGRVGSLDHSLSAAVLRSRGVDPDRIEFVAIGQPNVRAQALAAGQVDATTMSIGVWISLPDRSGLHVLVDPDAFYIAAPVLQKVNVVPDAVLAARGGDVAKVVRALILASRDFAHDQKLWVDAMALAQPDVARDDLETLARSFAASWSVNGGLNRGEIDYTVDWLYESPDFSGLRRPEDAEWVDFAVLDGVLAGIGTDRGADQPAR